MPSSVTSRSGGLGTHAASVLRAFVLLVPPWKLILGVSAATVLALSFPPHEYGWLGWVALVPLLVAARDMRPGGALIVGLAAGTVFFGHLLNYIRQFGALPWLALAVFQGAFIGLYGYLAALMWRCPCPFVRVPALGACWTATELLRGHLGALQFTFGDLGYTQYTYVPVLQLAALVGHYGLGFVMALFAAALVEGVPRLDDQGRPPTGGPLIILVCLLAGGFVWGTLRAKALQEQPTARGLEVAAIQGDVELQPTTEKFLTRTAELYTRMTLSAGKGAQLVVWPETAIPARLNEYPELYRKLQRLARRVNCTLLVGAAEAGRGGETYNTLWAFDRTGRLVSLYRKRRLVIFGEYLPWRENLKFLMNAYPIRDFDYSPGAGDVLVLVDDTWLSPMICFESIFPDISRRLVRRGAQLLVVATSDVWVGDSRAELWQHAQASVLRAVETGRWVVRAGGTGVTCVIDPSGRIVAEAAIFKNAAVRARVWPKMHWTPYVKFGDWPLTLVTGLLLLAGLADIHSEDREKL